VGVAGCGGSPISSSCGGNSDRSQGGGAGGNAINLSYPLSITNNGIIGGGGFGGTSFCWWVMGCVPPGNTYVNGSGSTGAGINGFWNGSGGGPSAPSYTFGCHNKTAGAGGALGTSGAAIKTNGNSYSVTGNSLFGSVIP